MAINNINNNQSIYDITAFLEEIYSPKTEDLSTNSALVYEAPFLPSENRSWWSGYHVRYQVYNNIKNIRFYLNHITSEVLLERSSDE